MRRATSRERHLLQCDCDECLNQSPMTLAMLEKTSGQNPRIAAPGLAARSGARVLEAPGGRSAQRTRGRR